MKLSWVREEKSDLKKWLRDVLPDDLSQQAVADELGVTRKTISNLLSPNAGFGNGLTMLRYLQLVGAVTEAPSAGSRLEELAGAVAGLTMKVDLGFEMLADRLREIETTTARQVERAPATSRRKRSA